MKPKLQKGQVLVLTGKQGCGKTTLAREIAKGHGSFEEIHGAQLDNQFELADALAKEPNTIIIDEYISHTGVMKLKEMVRSEEVTCNQKYQNPRKVKTPNFILCTGDPSPINLEHETRRFIMVTVDEDAG